MTALTDSLKLGYANDTSGVWKKELMASVKLSKFVTVGWISYTFYIMMYNCLYPLSVNGMEIEITEEGDQNIYGFPSDIKIDEKLAERKENDRYVYGRWIL